MLRVSADCPQTLGTANLLLPGAPFLVLLTHSRKHYPPHKFGNRSRGFPPTPSSPHAAEGAAPRAIPAPAGFPNAHSEAPHARHTEHQRCPSPEAAPLSSPCPGLSPRSRTNFSPRQNLTRTLGLRLRPEGPRGSAAPRGEPERPTAPAPGPAQTRGRSGPPAAPGPESAPSPAFVG